MIKLTRAIRIGLVASCWASASGEPLIDLVAVVADSSSRPTIQELDSSEKLASIESAEAAEYLIKGGPVSYFDYRRNSGITGELIKVRSPLVRLVLSAKSLAAIEPIVSGEGPLVGLFIAGTPVAVANLSEIWDGKSIVLSDSILAKLDIDSILDEFGIKRVGEFKTAAELQDAWKATKPFDRISGWDRAIEAGWISEPLEIQVAAHKSYFRREPLQLDITLRCSPFYDLSDPNQRTVFHKMDLLINDPVKDSNAVFRIRRGAEEVGALPIKRSVFESGDASLQEGWKVLRLGEAMAVGVNLTKDFGLEAESPEAFDVGIRALSRSMGIGGGDRYSNPVDTTLKIEPFVPKQFTSDDSVRITLQGSEADVQLGVYRHSKGEVEWLVACHSEEKLVRILRLGIQVQGKMEASLEWDERGKTLHILLTISDEGKLHRWYIVSEENLLGIRSSKSLPDAHYLSKEPNGVNLKRQN